MEWRGTDGPLKTGAIMARLMMRESESVRGMRLLDGSDICGGVERSIQRALRANEARSRVLRAGVSEPPPAYDE